MTIMKGISILLLAAFMTFISSPRADARTSVYVSFTVGGAAIVGGAFLFWSLTYGSRVSGIEHAPGTPAPALRMNFQDEQTAPLPSRSFSGHPGPSDGATITWPLLIYRW